MNLYRQRAQLGKIIDDGGLTKAEKLFSALVPTAGIRLATSRFLRRYSVMEYTRGTNEVTYVFPPYQGKNAAVIAMRDFIAAKLDGDVHAALLHGSLAVGDEITYSDFDAVIIIRDEVFEDIDRLVCVIRLIRKSTEIILRLDPLQHHGWTVLRERDLEDFPVNRLPPALLRHAVSLSTKDARLVLRFDIDSRAGVRAFEALANAVLAKLRKPRRVRYSPYHVKGLISQCLLLPALYWQARTGEGVFKRESFALVRAEMPVELWSTMEYLSKIRTDWDYHPGRFYRWLLERRHLIIRRYVRRLPWPLPAFLRVGITPDLLGRLERLIEHMLVRIAESVPRLKA